MITTKNNIIVVKLLIIFFLLCSPTESMESSILLKVNNEIISNYDIEQESKYLGALNSELNKLDSLSIKNIAKNSLIREKIKINEILKYFIFNKNENLVNNYLKNLYTNLNFTNEKEFSDYLETFDLKLTDIKTKFEIEILWNELIKKKFSNQLNINEDFLKKKIKDEQLSERSVTEYELSEILFTTDKDNNLKNKYTSIRNDISTSGFKNAANVYGVSDTAKFGGQIGWVSEGQLSKEILNSIKNLNIGDISEPVKTPGGYLILKVENKKINKIEIDEKIILKDLVNYEIQRQYNQLSLVYYSKIKLNSQISE